MLIDYDWLQDFFDKKLPSKEDIVEKLNIHSFETELNDKGLIDIDVLPNRTSDSLCYYGIAKEISAILDIPLKEDLLKNTKLLNPNNNLSIKIDDQRCNRYIGVRIKGIDNSKKSPLWLSKRLLSQGINTINPIVDITNYVMLMLGIPLHAFDINKLDGTNTKILVRSAKKGEEITTLLGDTYQLNNELLITDTKQPLAIAGIKGGNTAEIDENSTDIILEAAHFNPQAVRETSRKLKLVTDSSIRFSGNPSIHIVPYAIAFAVELIKKELGGKVDQITDEYPSPISQYSTGFYLSTLNKLSGMEFSNEKVKNIFDRLDFSYEIANPREVILKTANSLLGMEYKLGASILKDAPKKFDCSSFLGYCYAQAGIPIPRISFNQYAYSKQISQEDAKAGDLVFLLNKDTTASKIHNKIIKEKGFAYHINDIKDLSINHCGLYVGDGEIIHAKGGGNGVIRQKITDTNYDIVGFCKIIETDEDRFIIKSPLTRTDITNPEEIIEEVVRIIGYNAVPNSLPAPKKVKVNKKFHYINEILHIAERLSFNEVITSSFSKEGEVHILSPFSKKYPAMRDNLKNYLSNALKMNINNAELFALKHIKLIEIGTIFQKDKECLHIGIAIDGTTKNTRKSSQEKLQELFSALKEELGIDINGELKDGVWEGDITNIFDSLSEVDAYREYKITKNKFTPFSRYPFIVRDISVFTPEATLSKEVGEIIKSNGGELLLRYDLFDTYKKDNEISYAYRLIFQAKDRTLRDEEIAKQMHIIEEKINSKEGWTIR